MDRLRQFALEAITELQAQLASSPVPDAAVITRKQLEVLTEYVAVVKP